MKKRILASLLAVCMVLALLPAAALADSTADGTSYWAIGLTRELTGKKEEKQKYLFYMPLEQKTYSGADVSDPSGEVTISDAFGQLWGWTTQAISGEENVDTGLTTPNKFFEALKSETVTGTKGIFLERVSRGNETIDENIAVKNLNLWLMPSHVNGAILTFTGNISVEDGYLLIQSAGTAGMSYGLDLATTMKLSNSISVKNNGILCLDGQIVCTSDDSNHMDRDTYVVDSDIPVVKVETGGKMILNSASFQQPSNATSPAILVEGGTLVVNSGSTGTIKKSASAFEKETDTIHYSNSYSDLTATTSPIIQVTSGKVEINGGKLTATGDVPAVQIEGGSVTVNEPNAYPAVPISSSGTAEAIRVASGATLTLAGGEVTASGEGTPAITVAEGATLVIPADSAAKVTANNNNNQAIDLTPGSIVKAGDATVTVGSAEGDNYVDNSGKIVLASGSVTEGGQITELPNGGTVTPAAGENGTIIAPNTVSTEGVTLDKNALTLNLGETATLIATVTPDNATDKSVAWSSSNTSVATVDQSGNVTAVGYGNATITVTAGGKTATCTVTVAYPYIPVPPVAPTQPTKPAEPDQPEEPDTPVIPGSLPFVDVSANDWFYEDVAYVYSQGIMTGSTASTFAPNDAMTRAMVWTVLGRMSGEDVEGGTPWYALAQSWAVSSNVSDGTGPNDSITREQLVTMLYRQAGSPEVGVSELALLGRFTDGESVSDWAEEAMAWAVSQGILTGDGDLLRPQAAATRAQVAAILARYCEADKK